jgi:hypothetical protein
MRIAVASSRPWSLPATCVGWLDLWAVRPALLLIGLAFGTAAASSPAVAAEEGVDYLRQVKPLLANRCYACHGALKQEGGLRLDTAALLIKGGDSGPVAVAGKSSESAIIERVTHAEADLRMPPEGEAAPFTAEEVALLKRWIDAGAAGPAEEAPEADPRDHWAFRAPVRPAVPQLPSGAAGGNPIDAFLAAEQAQAGVPPQGPATRQVLLRRVYLDLIGLPPTSEETAAFLADTSHDAYEKVVARLLESPQYGERWGRHWMDVWRYSDWWGLGAEVRNSQKHMWHWRDWIVQSLNSDVGYDEMIRQMLAADELYPNDLEKLRGTGFLARHYFRFNRNTWMEETVEHTGKAFLGLTLNCARCHDHKYDPISQRDYYRFRAFFEPYQVRTEQVPGELDFEKNGIPRVFDCNAEAPTYLFTRGDEKKPVTTEPLPPGWPSLLSFEEMKIAPVDLPAEAHQPGLRSWVLANHLAGAEQSLAAARTSLTQAQQALASLEKKSAEPSADAETAPTFTDDFAAAQTERWHAITGDWQYEEGKLLQRSDGDVRGVFQLALPPPDDFQARLRFTITGGQQWKSVGLSFDLAGDHDVLVYLSAVANGSKLQVTHKQNGNYVYPPNSGVARSIKPGEPYDVTVQVRGELVNVSIGGEHALAYRLPIKRQAGKLALVTYDAQAAFHSFELAALPTTVVLQEPATPAAGSTAPQSIERARATLRVAENSLAFAELQPSLIRARAAADQARYASAPAANATELAQAAAREERRSQLAQAARDLAQAELELITAVPAKQEEADKKLAAARTALEQARKALETPGDTYTSLRGALKTPESNVEPEDHRNRPFPITSTGRRTALAQWITDRRHPLTARVAVNHIWARHMGAPLVTSVFDLGRKGSVPTHPQLLDWLAVELMEQQWSMKHLHRLIVTSNAYRRSSSSLGAEASQARDGENRLYWRMNATRMESQVVRDALLHLAGDLDGTLGGPSVPLAETEHSKRRSLYFVHSHNEHSRLLSLFDDANVLDCYRRDQSIVPQQALALSNSRLAIETSARIAARLPAESNASFLSAAFSLLLAVEPSPAECQACEEALAAWTASGLTAAQARANLIHALLNHNDFVTIR